MDGQMEAKRNRRHTEKLLRGFDRAIKRTLPSVEARYGPVLARTLIQQARQEFAHLAPDLPDLHRRQPFSLFIAATGWFLAFHRALAKNGRPIQEAGQFAYALTEEYVASVPRVARHLFRWVWFSKLFRRWVRFRAGQSQKHRQRGEFVHEYIEGDNQRFDFGVDYVECAVWTFLKSQGAPELAPYVCALDQIYSDAFGWGLVRTTTLAEGGSRCDFRFKRGGVTRIESTVLPLREQ